VSGGFKTHYIIDEKPSSMLTSVIWLSVKSMLCSRFVMGRRSQIDEKQISSIPHDLRLSNFKWFEIPTSVAILAILKGRNLF